VLVCDGLNCVGGRELMYRLCTDYLQALAHQRSQASRVTLLQLDNSLPATVAQCAASAVRTLDGCSDPHGWLRWVMVVCQVALAAAKGGDLF